MGGIPWKRKIGMQKGEHRMLRTRGRPRAGLGLTQAEVWGCGGGRLEAGWEQNTALGQELFLLAQIAQLSCCGSPPPSHSPQHFTLGRDSSGGGLPCENQQSEAGLSRTRPEDNLQTPGPSVPAPEKSSAGKTEQTNWIVCSNPSSVT